MRSLTVVSIFLIFIMLASSAISIPTLTVPRVTPATGDSDTMFTFTVHYAGNEPVLMELFLGSQAYTMLELDPDDNNYTDGKDYYFETQLPEGVTIYYFKATISPGEEIRTTATTVDIGAQDYGFDHLDVVLAVSFFVPVAILGLWMFRRFSKDLRDILDELRLKKID